MKEPQRDDTGAFKNVSLGGALTTMGAAMATILQFLCGLILVRITGAEEFGIVALAYILVSLLSLFGTLGFGNGLTYFLSGRRTNASETFGENVVTTAMATGLMAAGALTLLAIGSAGALQSILKQPGLEAALRILSLMVVPVVATNILTAVHRSVEDVRAKLLFQDISPNLIRAGLLLALLVAGFGYREALWAYAASAWISLGLYLVYTSRLMHRDILGSFDVTTSKALLLFSLPLAGSELLNSLVHLAGVLALGIWHSSEQIAHFSVAIRVAALLGIPLVAMSFIYLPVSSALSSSEAKKERAELYLGTAKIAFLVTTPAALYLLFNCEFLLSGFFGREYAAAGSALRFLCLGYAIHTFFGLNGITLISLGDSSGVLRGSIVSGLTLMIFCLILVPPYASPGAALATASALLASNCYLSIRLYRRTGIHVLHGHYLRPAALTITVCGASFAVLRLAHNTNVSAHLAVVLAAGIFALATPALTGSLTASDRELLSALKYRTRSMPRQQK